MEEIKFAHTHARAHATRRMMTSGKGMYPAVTAAEPGDAGSEGAAGTTAL